MTKSLLRSVVLLFVLYFTLAAAKQDARPNARRKRDPLSFSEHYYDYLRSPAVIVLLCVLIVPLMYQTWKKLQEQQRLVTSLESECYRLGLSKRSNLDDQYQPTTNPSKSEKPRVKALFTYPIKSCRGVELAASEVVSTGLKYDRIFTFAQLVSKPTEAEGSSQEKVSPVSHDWKHEWRFITQREFPRLSLLETELWVPRPVGQKKSPRARGLPIEPPEEQKRTWLASNGGVVGVRFPFSSGFDPFGLRTETVALRLPLVPNSERARSKRYTRETLSIWKDQASAINLTNEIPPDTLAKLKYFLGVSNPLAVFRVDDSKPRSVTRSLPKDNPGGPHSVGFGDAFPLHILGLPSVRAITDELPENAKMKSKFDARRFRANIYLDGVPAYDEDTWKRVRIGQCVRPTTNRKKFVETEGEYHVACRTARCTLPNVDQETGVKDANEPYTTLGKTRKVDRGAYPHPCLGMQMIPMFSYGLLKVGDEVDVVETGEHVYEKMFA
ncbi:hypothetical protein LTR09_007608 [Extremus antarcticus]|uniref:MOSC domain-containing protein n=1 Tax=Extremus antarcticus TaxID=702011 RepID=A0AAJ0DC98_9PEZI|nr:hypothetical protein LTR09_007608 [Extremus antarcticus]